jgi:Zn-dependent M16 (insulinase) family peptidase
MTEEEIFKLVNQGYLFELATPVEFKKAIQSKLIDLAENGKDKERHKAILKGYELGQRERTKERLKQIEITKKGRRRTGPTRER